VDAPSLAPLRRLLQRPLPGLSDASSTSPIRRRSRSSSSEPAVFRAGEANPSALGPALGSYSLLTLDRDEHLSQRKLLQMKVILRTILRRARLRAADPRPERPRVRHVTAVPGQGARAVLQERVPSGAPRAPLAAAV
jgi:cytochrome P450